MAEVNEWDDRHIDRFTSELADTTSRGETVAYRGGHRWVQTYEPIPLPARSTRPAVLHDRGVYLVTGGLGEVGYALAGYLARETQARLVLIGRSELPPREEWAQRQRDDTDGMGRRIQRVLQITQRSPDSRRSWRTIAKRRESFDHVMKVRLRSSSFSSRSSSVSPRWRTA